MSNNFNVDEKLDTIDISDTIETKKEQEYIETNKKQEGQKESFFINRFEPIFIMFIVLSMIFTLCGKAATISKESENKNNTLIILNQTKQIDAAKTMYYVTYSKHPENVKELVETGYLIEEPVVNLNDSADIYWTFDDNQNVVSENKISDPLCHYINKTAEKAKNTSEEDLFSCNDETKQFILYDR
jgi:hypothetical protein